MYQTEKEILARQGEQLFGIQKIIRNANVSLDEVAELVPCLVHLSRIHTLDLVYLDKKSREKLELEKEDLLKNGLQILMNIVKPESFQQAKMLFSKMDFKDPALIASHFQALKGFPDKNKYKWFYSVKKKFNDGLIITITNPVADLESMYKQIRKIMEEDQFIRNKQSKVNSLSPREKEVMKLISKGYNSNQIAEKLFISPYTVSTHRKHIWHKLEIKSYSELIRLAEHFNLL